LKFFTLLNLAKVFGLKRAPLECFSKKSFKSNKSIIQRSGDLDFILQIRCSLHHLLVLVRVDIVKAADNKGTKSLHFIKHCKKSM
jgi:hypothetical protein